MKIELDSLETYNRLAKNGAQSAAQKLTALVDMDVDVTVTKVDFVPSNELGQDLDNKKYRGVEISLKEHMEGKNILLFDEDGSEEVVSSLVPASGEFGEMEKSAIQEIGNIMTSGFIDGWADHLDTSIDHNPPKMLEDIGKSIAESLTVRLAQEQDFVFIFDTQIIADKKEFNSNLYVFFRKEDIVKSLKNI